MDDSRYHRSRGWGSTRSKLAAELAIKRAAAALPEVMLFSYRGEQVNSIYMKVSPEE